MKPQPFPVPLENCGKWIAWNHERTKIIASGNTFREALEAAEKAGEPKPIFARAPDADRRFAGGAL